MFPWFLDIWWHQTKDQRSPNMKIFYGSWTSTELTVCHRTTEQLKSVWTRFYNTAAASDDWAGFGLFDTLQLLQYNEHLAENAETLRGASVWKYRKRWQWQWKQSSHSLWKAQLEIILSNYEMQDQEQRDKHEKTQTVAERPSDTRAVQIQFFSFLWVSAYWTYVYYYYTICLNSCIWLTLYGCTQFTCCYLWIIVHQISADYWCIDLFIQQYWFQHFGEYQTHFWIWYLDQLALIQFMELYF